MPVSPAYAEGLAQPTVDIYAQAELILLERIATYLTAGDFDVPDWLERKLIQAQLLQRYTARVLTEATTQGTLTAAEATAKAYNRGVSSADADLAKVLRPDLLRAVAVQSSLDALTATTGERLRSVYLQTVRLVPSIYRQVAIEAAGQVLTGTLARRQAADRALSRLATNGITGYTDGAGRHWSLPSYVEMAVRSATSRAAVEGHTERLRSQGLELVMVSDAPQECVLCRPFEGKVFWTGPTPPAKIHGAKMSLDAARAQGLFHPNCRHSTALYQPGVTVQPTDTEDPQGDQDRQTLRRLERSVRAAKRRAAVATTPDAKRQATARVRAGQAAIREHVAKTTAKRQVHRESLGAL